MLEQEIRPTPAALIDEEFVKEIEAFFHKQTEFNERLEQRVAEQKSRKIDSRLPNGKRLLKEFSVSHLTDTNLKVNALNFV